MVLLRIVRMSPAAASTILCRSVPGPRSAMLVTTSVAARGREAEAQEKQSQGEGEKFPKETYAQSSPEPWAELVGSAGCQPAVSQVANLPGRAGGRDVGAVEEARPAIARPADLQPAF